MAEFPGTRALGATVAVLTDVQLAVIAAALLVDLLRGPAPGHVGVLLLAMLPALVRLGRRGRLGTSSLRGRLLTIADVLTAVAVLTVVGSDSLVLVFIATTVVLCGLEHPPRGPVLVTAVLAAVHGAAILAVSGDVDARSSGPILLVRIGLLALAAYGSARLREIIIHREQLGQAYQELQQERLREAERTRLAREMHDSLSKTLHGCCLIVGALHRRLAGEGNPLADQAALLRTSIDEALGDARRIIGNLRQTPVASLRAHLLDTVTAWSQDRSIQVELDLPDEEPRLSADAREELAKAVGELLENVARHSGANRVEVTLAVDGPDVVLTVADDGRGMAGADGGDGAEGMSGVDLQALYQDGHYGLVGVRERLARLGGSVELRTAPGRGTTVSLRTALNGGTVRSDVAARVRGVVPVHRAAEVH
ncbi:MAG: hypothetical protein GXX79_14695 [Actinomycetales bacterium]|nr:hypothetical protein [Actinomycetales bacterium]